jgi:hypothetical protein
MKFYKTAAPSLQVLSGYMGIINVLDRTKLQVSFNARFAKHLP